MNGILGYLSDEVEEYYSEQKESEGFRFYENSGSNNKLDPFIFNESTTFQYPLSVGDVGNEEQPHSVCFYINARENSRVVGETDTTLAPVDTTAENRRTAEENKSIGNIVSGAVGLGGGFKVVGALANGSSFLARLIGGAAGAYVTAELAESVIETTSKVRTLGAIELYVAAPPVAQYSANWENKELGALAGLAGNPAFDQGVTFDSILKTAGPLVARSAIKAAANLPGSIGIGGELGASIDLASSKVANPYKEQLFSNMGFRQFAFNYKFTPRNKQEYSNVQRIIQLFKYHMHPEVSPSKLFLEYPSEFEIEYHYKGKENPHVSKISSCALTDVKITYGNQDAFTTIKGENGAPAEINMQLAFTELETLTNERIADGY
jgi:hypothetical protein